MADKINSNERQANEKEMDEIQEKSQQLINTAKSGLVYLIISVFASLVTTISLFLPEQAMNIIEKIVDIPYTDYDSIANFKLVMVIANLSILSWEIYGILNIVNFF